MEKLTHIDERGRPRMVDVGGKPDTHRAAVAKGSIYMKPETLKRILEGGVAKGDVLSVAQTAGILAAKQTASAIPMCHNVFITSVEMDFIPDEAASAIHIEAAASTVGKTGIEMEALHAVSIAALTIYDMCKAMDRSMRITDLRLIQKSGGSSGEYREEGRSGRVLAVNISDYKGVVKRPVEEAVFLKNQGIRGDAHCGEDPIRQVSLLANESADKMRAMGLELSEGAFAENITTQGIELKSLPIGTRLRIGETLQEVSQIGKECHHGCAIREQTGCCVMPTEGIFTVVLQGGIVRPGDEIRVV